MQTFIFRFPVDHIGNDAHVAVVALTLPGAVADAIAAIHDVTGNDKYTGNDLTLVAESDGTPGVLAWL